MLQTLDVRRSPSVVSRPSRVDTVYWNGIRLVLIGHGVLLYDGLAFGYDACRDGWMDEGENS